MHLHLPKPLHGWREFAGEVGIIVIGVLIALGAEQTVEAIHSRSLTEEFRGAADAESARNLAAYFYRLSQSGCVQKRISDLASWGEAKGSNSSFEREIGRPSVIGFQSSVWNARGDAIERMPLRERLAYSGLYDDFANVQTTLEAERDVWRSLAAFNGAPRLSDDAKMRLNELLYRAKTLDWVVRANRGLILNRAAKLNIRPSFGEDRNFLPVADPSFCAPLVAQPGKRRS